LFFAKSGIIYSADGKLWQLRDRGIMRKTKTFGGNKFDIQLSEAEINERKLHEIFTAKKIEKIELKSETWQWEKTGNVFIEYKQNGEPSGISVTEADYWVHELKRDGKTLVYLMFPLDRLKELAREAIRKGRKRTQAGDGGRFEGVTIRLSEILK
jgi:hypothetical protein